MKATDLMIGDWVRVTRTVRPKECIARVIDIDEDGIWVRENEGGEWFIHLNEASHIPLTPEILEKNGFLKTEDWFCLGEDYYDIDIIEISDGIWRVMHDNLDCSAITDTLHICYLHELQHALKLFGIEKEIEL